MPTRSAFQGYAITLRNAAKRLSHIANRAAAIGDVSGAEKLAKVSVLCRDLAATADTRADKFRKTR